MIFVKCIRVGEMNKWDYIIKKIIIRTRHHDHHCYCHHVIMIIMMVMTIIMRRDCIMLRGGRSRFLCAVGGDGGILARTQPKNTEYTQNIHRKFYEEQLATDKTEC